MELWYGSDRVPDDDHVEDWPGVQPRGEISEGAERTGRDRASTVATSRHRQPFVEGKGLDDASFGCSVSLTLDRPKREPPIKRVAIPSPKRIKPCSIACTQRARW
eukprot:5457767-Amphidinium_carterae.1